MNDTTIHFFTIVLNGQPFIRYHELLLSRLSMKWHWHIIEGVAGLAHDTAWSVAGGGTTAEVPHKNGLSVDGTKEYIDELAARRPDDVTVYRKSNGQFWDGKKEMCNVFLPNITSKCLLWQIDADELWSAEQIQAVYDLFAEAPSRSAAFFWCTYFVGPTKAITTRNGYAQNPSFEWLRVWRFEPGDVWAAHEPPTLVRTVKRWLRTAKTVDIAHIEPFLHAETEAVAAVFQHFAYATEPQAEFKEKYYGYRDALLNWRRLQRHEGEGRLGDYFDWVRDATLFNSVPDDYKLLAVEHDGRWTFDI